MKGFEKCRISSAVDGTGGDMTCCGMAVKRMGMLGLSVCEEDEGTDCEDGGSGTDWYRWIEYDMLCVLCVGN